jgi:hypothetical protein
MIYERVLTMNDTSIPIVKIAVETGNLNYDIISIEVQEFYSRILSICIVQPDISLILSTCCPPIHQWPCKICHFFTGSLPVSSATNNGKTSKR